MRVPLPPSSGGKGTFTPSGRRRDERVGGLLRLRHRGYYGRAGGPAGGQGRGGQRGADRDRRVQRDVRVRDGQQSLTVSGVPRPVPQGEALAVYRVVQESLTNVRKHAG